MVFDPKKYPPHWKELRAQCLERDKYRCVRCGVADKAYGARDLKGNWHDENDIHNLNSDVGFSLFGENFDWKMIRIRLTCHHTCHDKVCDDLSHLESLCQKCHLAEHRQDAQDGRRRKKLETQPLLIAQEGDIACRKEV